MARGLACIRTSSSTRLHLRANIQHGSRSTRADKGTPPEPQILNSHGHSTSARRSSTPRAILSLIPPAWKLDDSG
jgi:hypothetical protein